MRVNCVICGELAIQNQQMSAAPCGHIFHTTCILQWLERSKTCPQCRSKVTDAKLNRLYFDPGFCDGNTPDPDSLQHQIDNLKFQVKLKEQEAKKVSEEKDGLTAQAVALREEFKSLEKTVRDRDNTILALKSQMKHFDKTVNDAKKAKEEAKTLRQQLNKLKGVEKVLTGTNEDVESLVLGNNASDIKSLATFITVLKKELVQMSEVQKKLRAKLEASTRTNNKKELREKVLQEDVDNLTAKLKQYEEDNKYLEDENGRLSKKVQFLEQAVVSPSEDVRNSALHRLLSESPAPVLLKRQHSASDNDCVTPKGVAVKKRHSSLTSKSELHNACSSSSSAGASDSTQIKDKINPALDHLHFASSTPSLVQPLSDNLNTVNDKKQHNNHLFAWPNKDANSSLGASKMTAKSFNVGYDGMGGHHKFEEFPKPLRSIRPKVLQTTTNSSSKKKPTMMVVGGGNVGGVRISKGIENYFLNTFE